MLKKCLYKRDCGGYADMLYFVIGLVAIVFILLCNMNITTAAAKRSRIELVVHEYIMRMESEGYLSSTEQNELSDALKAAGMPNPTIRTGSNDKVKYGEKVVLSISGDLVTKSYEFDTDRFTMTKADLRIPVSVTKQSISKHAE